MPSRKFWIGAAVALVFAMSYNYAISETVRAANGDGEVMLLNDRPCVNKTILKLIRTQAPDFKGSFQAGTYINPKQVRSPVCWTLLNDSNVGIIHEDGDAGMIPVMAFEPVKP